MTKKTVDVQLLNPFLTATVECLQQMAGLQAVSKRVFVKTDPQMHGQVTGIIGMTNGLTGNVAVSFPFELAKAIVGRFIGESAESLTNEIVADGIGEVANMVAGGAKRLFASTAYRFDISTPTIIIGWPACLYNPAETVSIASEFSVEAISTESFLVEIALKPSTM